MDQARRSRDTLRVYRSYPLSRHSIALRSAVALAVISLAGCQAKTEPVPTRLMSSATVVSPALDSLLLNVQAVNQQLAEDAIITIYCEAEQVQCHYPDGFLRNQWGCTINHDLNEDGIIDKNEAVYGADAEARLSRCVRPQ